MEMKIRAYFLRLIFKDFIIELSHHPIYKGELFSRIEIAKEMYYYVDDYKVLKSKK